MKNEEIPDENELDEVLSKLEAILDSNPSPETIEIVIRGILGIDKFKNVELEDMRFGLLKLADILQREERGEINQEQRIKEFSDLIFSLNNKFE